VEEAACAWGGSLENSTEEIVFNSKLQHIDLISYHF
jgi:hypothetical protein